MRGRGMSVRVSHNILETRNHPTERLGVFQDGMNFILGEVSSTHSVSQNPLDLFCNSVNQGAAFLSLLSLLSTFVRPLRPLSAAGIRILSAPPVSALLLATGTYALAHQMPYAVSAFSRLSKEDYSDSKQNRLQDVVELASFGIGSLATLVSLGSFVLGGRSYLNMRRALSAEGLFSPLAHRSAWMQADAVRRAFHDPQIWMQYSREALNLNAFQRSLIYQVGKWNNRLLIGGSALVGAGRFYEGSQALGAKYKKGEELSFHDYFSLGMQLALEMTPAMTVLLYRGARGDYRYGVGAAWSQNLSDAAYLDPALQRTVQERLRRAIPSLSPEREVLFRNQADADLAKAAELLRLAETLPAHVSSGKAQGWALQAPPENLPAPSLPVLGSKDYSAWGVFDFLRAYREGAFSPSEVLAELLRHPASNNGSIFPRSLHEGKLSSTLAALARESDARYQTGNTRPLEGVIVAVKDIFPGVDGIAQVGSKTTRLTNAKTSPVLDILLEMGGIPIPVGMVAAANGASGQYAGFGYVPHPKRAGFDPAGSSSAVAHVVGLPDLPIQMGIGTDTGGSISAPAGAVGLFGLVPPRGAISTKNMVPIATYLDRVGILTQKPEDGINLARLLARRVAGDPHMTLENPAALFHPSEERPQIFFLNDLFWEASMPSQRHFLAEMERLKAQGYEVRGLDFRWNFLAQVPGLLYPFDAYSGAAFTHTNPFQRNFWDPPRTTLDANLLSRLPKAALALKYGYFEYARALSHRLSTIVSAKFPPGTVLASPATEAIPTQELFQGRAEARLNVHDAATMLKNRLDHWGQVSVPFARSSRFHTGIAFSGHMPDLLRILEEAPLPSSD